MTSFSNQAPTPAARATMLLILGLIVTDSIASQGSPVALAHDYAVGIGLSLLVSLAVDYRGSVRNLVRADLMAIGSFYFLTFFEFLLPQPAFNEMVTLDEARPACFACLLGFAGLAIGRHVAPRPPRSLERMLQRDFSPGGLVLVFTGCLVFSYLYMLVAVDFDPIELVHQFMAPRFSQPWGRSRLGDWKALFGELGMLIYLIPPIAGIILAKRHLFTYQQKTYVAAASIFTFFYGFSSGTRNIFATFLATFLVAFAFAIDPRKKRELFVTLGVAGGLMLLATTTMLEFRNIGLEQYLQGRTEQPVAKKETTFFVDYNLYVISKLTAAIPRNHDYLGFEIPYLALIRPIPRAIWSGKPEGMSVSIEDVVGVEGLTLASSFAGEAYMSGGIIGVVVTAIVFGAITGWWNRLGRPDNSTLGHLIFASGFFAAVISMRSMFVFTTAMLPTLAALVVGNWLLDKRRPRKTPVEPPAPPAA